MIDVTLLCRLIESRAAREDWESIPPLTGRIEQLLGSDATPEIQTFCTYYRGLALLESERPTEALPSLERLVALDPSNPHFRMILSDALVRARRWKEARQALEAALEQAPEHPGCLCALGWVLFQTGARHRGKALLERAVSLHPDYHPAHADLGLILAVEGRWEESEYHLRTALALAPDDPDIREALRIVQDSRQHHGSDRDEIRALFPEIRAQRSRLAPPERQVLRRLRRWLRDNGASHLEILLLEGVWADIVETVKPTPSLDPAWAAALAWMGHRMLGHDVRRADVAAHWGVSTGVLARRYRKIRQLMEAPDPYEASAAAPDAPAGAPAPPHGVVIPVDFHRRRG